MKVKLLSAIAAVVLITGCAASNKSAWELNVPAKQAPAPTVIVNMPKPPKLWIHGHMHNRSDYMIGDTRIVCNPRGYAGHDWHAAEFKLQFLEV